MLAGAISIHSSEILRRHWSRKNRDPPSVTHSVFSFPALLLPLRVVAYQGGGGAACSNVGERNEWEEEKKRHLLVNARWISLVLLAFLFFFFFLPYLRSCISYYCRQAGRQAGRQAARYNLADLLALLSFLFSFYLTFYLSFFLSFFLSFLLSFPRRSSHSCIILLRNKGSQPDLFTTLKLLVNAPHDVPEIHEIRRSPNVGALKMWKDLSGGRRSFLTIEH